MLQEALRHGIIELVLRTESRLPHVLQRFVGTNFLSDGDLADNLLTKHPENTLSDTSLYAELVRLELVRLAQKVNCLCHLAMKSACIYDFI